MDKAQKAAMAKGRQEGQAVKEYLNLLAEFRPRRGGNRKYKKPADIDARLREIDEEFPTLSPLHQLELAQERVDLMALRATMTGRRELTAAEQAFVKVAAQYAERKGISYEAFREVGVPAEVLRRAGVS